MAYADEHRQIEGRGVLSAPIYEPASSIREARNHIGSIGDQARKNLGKQRATYTITLPQTR